jgi:hypothetical protein
MAASRRKSCCIHLGVVIPATTYLSQERLRYVTRVVDDPNPSVMLEWNKNTYIRSEKRGLSSDDSVGVCILFPVAAPRMRATIVTAMGQIFFLCGKEVWAQAKERGGNRKKSKKRSIQRAGSDQIIFFPRGDCDLCVCVCGRSDLDGEGSKRKRREDMS